MNWSSVVWNICKSRNRRTKIKLPIDITQWFLLDFTRTLLGPKIPVFSSLPEFFCEVNGTYIMMAIFLCTICLPFQTLDSTRKYVNCKFPVSRFCLEFCRLMNQCKTFDWLCFLLFYRYITLRFLYLDIVLPKDIFSL